MVNLCLIINIWRKDIAVESKLIKNLQYELLVFIDVTVKPGILLQFGPLRICRSLKRMQIAREQTAT